MGYVATRLLGAFGILVGTGVLSFIFIAVVTYVRNRLWQRYLTKSKGQDEDSYWGVKDVQMVGNCW